MSSSEPSAINTTAKSTPNPTSEKTVTTPITQDNRTEDTSTLKPDETSPDVDDEYNYEEYNPYEYDDEECAVKNDLVDLISQNTDESSTDATNEKDNEKNINPPETSDEEDNYNYDYDPYAYDYPEETRKG